MEHAVAIGLRFLWKNIVPVAVAAGFCVVAIFGWRVVDTHVVKPRRALAESTRTIAAQKQEIANLRGKAGVAERQAQGLERQVKAAIAERNAAQARARRFERYRGETANVAPQDNGPVAPVLRRAFERVHDELGASPERPGGTEN
jgi:hypothetical protein